MKKAIVFGTGSFGEIVDLYLRTDAGYDVVAFSVTADKLNSCREYKGRPVVNIDELGKKFDPGDTEVFVAVGYRKLNSIRRDICQQVKSQGFSLLSYVSSRSSRMPEVEIGENVFIFEDNTLQPFSKVGDGVIMWSGNHFGHHSVIGSWCFITSHVVISGHCEIGERSFLGVNATIADGVGVGPRNLIGPGALIEKGTGPDEVWLSKRAEKFARSSKFFLR